MQYKIHLLIICLILSSFNIFSLNKYPLDSDYHDWSTLDDSLLYHFSNDRYNSEIEIIGFSNNENLPIYAMHIHSFPESSRGHLWEKELAEGTKKILIIGQHHGEEPAGVEIAMDFIKDLTSDPMLTDLKEDFYFVIIPTVNPEGFRIVNDGVYPLRRKNNSDTDFNNKFDIATDGVDLNKNYPYNWEKADLNDPNEQYYKGGRPASESETRAVMQLAEREKFDYAFSYHTSYNGSYTEIIFVPYNWHNEKSKDWNKLHEKGKILVKNLNRHYLQGQYVVHKGYTSEYGYFRDWIYNTCGTLPFTLEVGALTLDDKVLYFPDNSDLQVIVNKNTNAVYQFLKSDNN